MGLLTSLFAGMRFGADYKPWDDFFYQKDPRFGLQTHAGITATPEVAMRLGAVYSCVRILSDLVGYIPLHVYRRRADEGKDRATDLAEYHLLRRRPNQYQTAIRWRQQGQRHVLLRGNFYNLIVRSTRRIQELIPMDPDRMTVKLLPSGRRGYIYRSSDTQPAMVLTQDEVFHVMGFSLDGITGCSVIEYARETVGRAMAQELHNARFWSAGASEKGALATEGKLTTEQREANSKAWQDAQGGWWNAHKIALLEGGLKWQKIGVSAHDAQSIEGEQFSLGNLARFFGVPPHMIGDVEKSTSWGSGIQEQFIGFLVTTMEPWFTAWEQDIDRQILDDDDDIFAEFLRDAMLRADLEARSQADRLYVDGGIDSVNEVRIRNNKNPIKGEQYEKPQRAQNIGGGGDPKTSLPAGRPSRNGNRPEPADDAADARAQAFVLRTATRMVRKEIGAIGKWAPKYAANPAGWREWVCDFYGKHASVLEEALGLDQTQARQYGAAHTAALLEQGVAVLEEWERHAPAALTALALGEELVLP